MRTCLAALIVAMATPGLAESQVAARDIARGTVLSAEDIVTADTARTAVVPGWITRRKITAGETLRSPAVAPPDVVQAGTTVRFRMKRGDVSLLFKGTAISSGALGDTVFVRLDTRMRFRGVVTGPGFVIATDSLRP